MLEEKLDNLIKSIDILSAAIQDLTVARPVKKVDMSKAEKVADTPAPTESKTRRNDKEIQDLCLKIVRDDKKNGTKHGKAIRGLIKEHGGELVKDVPTEKLAELQAALEALKNG
jgi:hypothetical protein